MCVCVRACVCACVRKCLRVRMVCVRVCVRVCLRVCVVREKMEAVCFVGVVVGVAVKRRAASMQVVLLQMFPAAHHHIHFVC